jgi:hypothetical protein
LIEILGGGVGKNNFAGYFKNHHWLLLKLGGIGRGHCGTEIRRYVDRIVQQQMKSKVGSSAKAGPTRRRLDN